jgi:predicted DNA-binding WGR domain protein
MSEWGRVGDDGTVYVRAADGAERPVGSWQAGAPEEGLAHFTRRYEALATEVTLLEQRLRSGAGDPNQVATSAKRLSETLPTANAVGDLASLERRVQALTAATAEAVEKAQAARAEAREQAAVQKTALADEAEKLAGSSEWKTAGERLRTIGDDWKALPKLERKVDDELWQRVAAARKRFAERRTTHFGALEEQRTVSKSRKEKLIKIAEELSGSTDWKATAERFKSLMSDWKSAGRAPREVEDVLWASFKAAQDAFFTARNAQFTAQDEEFRGNQKVKEEILTQAEALDFAGAPEKSTARLRELQERWEKAGKVPRDAMRSLEDRMGAVEKKVRETSEKRWQAASASPFEIRLREKVAELEQKLEKARAAGRPTDELEQQLATQREWLTQAGSGTSEPASTPEAGPAGDSGGGARPASDAPARKKPTTAWVRADA